MSPLCGAPLSTHWLSVLLLPRRRSQVTVGTFHSVGEELLRRHGDALQKAVSGLDDKLSILDVGHSQWLLTDVMNDLRVGYMKVGRVGLRLGGEGASVQIESARARGAVVCHVGEMAEYGVVSCGV